MPHKPTNPLRKHLDWPADWAGPCKTPEGVRSAMDELESGNHAARFAGAVGRGLSKFFEELTPADYARAGRLLLEVVTTPANGTRSRIRAVQAALRPLQKAIAIFPELVKAQRIGMVVRLRTMLQAFVEAIGEDGFGRMARELAGIANDTTAYEDLAHLAPMMSPGHPSRPKVLLEQALTNRIRAVELMTTIVTDLMKTLGRLDEIARDSEVPIEENSSEVRVARATMDRWRREIEATQKARN